MYMHVYSQLSLLLSLSELNYRLSFSKDIWLQLGRYGGRPRAGKINYDISLQARDYNIVCCGGWSFEAVV